MAFFENLGKKISRVGEVTVDKTKKVTNIAIVNTKISEAERKIEKLYKDLGEAYCVNFGDNPANELKIIIDDINLKKSEIEELRKELDDIKGVKKCNNCGENIDSTAAFCPKCGAQIPVEEAKEVEEIKDVEVVDAEVVEAESNDEKKSDGWIYG